MEQNISEATPVGSEEEQQSEKNPPSSPTRRTRRSSGDAGRKPASTRARAQNNDKEILLDAVTALTTLAEGGKFFLVIENPDGEKSTHVNWN